MWQASNSRLKMAEGSKKLRESRLKRPIHVQRTDGELRIQNDEGGIPLRRHIRILLNDISNKDLRIYSAAAFREHQEVIIHLKHPSEIQLHGKVVWCMNTTARSKVMFEHPFSYRLGIQLIFHTKEAEKELRAYCEQLSKVHLYPPAAQAA